MKKVAFIGGYWSSNIGNAFFNLGAEYVLGQVFGEENVTMVMDQSAYMLQWKTRRGNIPWALDYWAHLCVDFVVLLGPCLSRNFLPIWRDTLNLLRDRGVGYMILSAGMMKCGQDDLRQIKEFFADNPPYVMTTRDSDTYAAFRDAVPRIYDGICFAFFMPDCYHPIPTDIGPSIVLNFDKIAEPHLSLDAPMKHPDHHFELDGHRFDLRYSGGLLSKIGRKTDRLTDAIIYLSALLPRGKRPERLGEYTLIRTDHRFAPMMIRKVYRYANSFCADIPHTYANIYAEANLTVSDRVHACAMALAYGKTAMLLARTNRDALLERVGAAGITKHPVKIDTDLLKREKENLIAYLRSIEY